MPSPQISIPPFDCYAEMYHGGTRNTSTLTKPNPWKQNPNSVSRVIQDT